ncbi:MAG TPA: hypothetical protein VL944_02325 [Candidatus Acidoferrum sp.]|nr:hypothetical protein [Candidatus Acidoferrum sp.]
MSAGKWHPGLPNSMISVPDSTRPLNARLEIPRPINNTMVGLLRFENEVAGYLFYYESASRPLTYRAVWLQLVTFGPGSTPSSVDWNSTEAFVVRDYLTFERVPLSPGNGHYALQLRDKNSLAIRGASFHTHPVPSGSPEEIEMQHAFSHADKWHCRQNLHLDPMSITMLITPRGILTNRDGLELVILD